MRLWVSKLDRETQWKSEGHATGPPGKLVELVNPGVAGDTALSCHLSGVRGSDTQLPPG